MQSDDRNQAGVHITVRHLDQRTYVAELTNGCEVRLRQLSPPHQWELEVVEDPPQRCELSRAGWTGTVEVTGRADRNPDDVDLDIELVGRFRSDSSPEAPATEVEWHYSYVGSAQ